MNKKIISLLFSILLLSMVISYGGSSFGQYKEVSPSYTIKEIHNIKFDKTSYATTESVKITITDYSLNKNSKSYDSISVEIFSKLFPTKKIYTVKETSLNSGVFITKLKISNITTKTDTLFAKYNFVENGLKKQSTASASVIMPKIAYEPIQIKPTLEKINLRDSINFELVLEAICVIVTFILSVVR